MPSELKKKVLEELLNNSDNYVEASYIANKTGTSIMSVNKIIKSLISDGYIITIDKRRGYKLIIDEDLSFLAGKVWNIKDKTITLYYFKSCSSTQDIGHMLAKSGVPEYTIVIAGEQYSGRGRYGRRWISPPGGLWFTIILRDRSAKDLTLLNIMAGISIAKALRDLYKLDAKIKWPNDVLINNKKIAGVLIEGNIKNDIADYLLIGIGVNINNDIPMDMKSRAISLKEIIGKAQPRSPILKAIVRIFTELDDSINKGLRDRVLSYAKYLLSTLNKKIVIRTPTGIISGNAYDIDENGGLRVLISDKDIRTVYIGEIVKVYE